MKPRSLRVRLLLGAAIAIFLALAAAWLAMTLLFERHIERRAQADLIRDGMQLAAGVSVDADGRPVLSRAPGDARFEEPASGITGHSWPFTMTVAGGEACSEAFSRTNNGFSAGTRLLGLSGCQPSWMG